MAQRATSLGPKPSLFIYFCVFLVCLCSFPFFALYYKKNLVFPLEKGIFGLFLSVSLCSSLGFFGLPLFFNFSFSVYLFFFSFFPSFLSFFFAFFCFLVFVSFFPFLSSLLLFHEKKQHQKDWCTKFSFINLFSFLVSCLLFSLKSLFLLFVFCWFKVMFLFNIFVFGFKKNQVEKHQFLVKRGVATKRVFFMTLCFAKREKLSFFWGGHFFGKFCLRFKKHYKNRYFSTFLESKNN